MKKSNVQCLASFLAVSSFVCMSVGIWTYYQACDVYNNQIGCSIGKAYLTASEIDRRYDTENTTVTVNYCSANVYRCDSTESYGYQCSGDVVQCTWSFGREPKYTVPKIKHIVVANTVSNPIYSYTQNVCFVDNTSTFQQMVVMQKLTLVLLTIMFPVLLFAAVFLIKAKTTS